MRMMCTVCERNVLMQTETKPNKFSVQVVEQLNTMLGSPTTLKIL